MTRMMNIAVLPVALIACGEGTMTTGAVGPNVARDASSECGVERRYCYAVRGGRNTGQ